MFMVTSTCVRCCLVCAGLGVRVIWGIVVGVRVRVRIRVRVRVRVKCTFLPEILGA